MGGSVLSLPKLLLRLLPVVTPRRKTHMNIDTIVAELKQERTRLDQAISALEGAGRTSPGRGRPPKSSQPSQPARRGPRTMSAAARAKIAAAQRARWAKQKGHASATKPSAAKKSGKAQKASRRGPMSPAARKRLSALMKARWAERKKAA
jgi:hypothetical protein